MELFLLIPLIHQDRNNFKAKPSQTWSSTKGIDQFLLKILFALPAKQPALAGILEDESPFNCLWALEYMLGSSNSTGAELPESVWRSFKCIPFRSVNSGTRSEVCNCSEGRAEPTWLSARASRFPHLKWRGWVWGGSGFLVMCTPGK